MRVIISMTLEKIDPRTIELDKRQYFYRAVPQGFVESRILQIAKYHNRPCYVAQTGINKTFVTNDFLLGLGYAQDWTALMDSKGVPFPFTEYVTFFGISAHPYLDRLYRDTSGNEGIVIKGPIDLQDIEVMFSADRNVIDKLELDDVVLPSRRSGNVRRTFERKKADLFQMAGDPPHLSLVRRYGQDSQTLVEQIHTYLEGLKHMVGPRLTKSEIKEMLPKVVSAFGPLPEA